MILGDNLYEMHSQVLSKKKKKIQIIYNLCHVSQLDEPQVKHWHFKIILPD